MKPTRVIAWLLLLYWFSIAIANVSFFQGPSLRSGLEFPLYTGIGIVCYHATLKIGKHFPRQRKPKYYKGSSRR
ncbi:MAG: hypothetical protein FJZ95_00720 [Chloroflexi bacterium]|nr:hypothetical protein [Chloroflexota bacterium]